jgi:hypothetical protein
LEVSTPKKVIEALVIVAVRFVLKRLKRVIQSDTDLYCGCETHAARNIAHIEPGFILNG